MRLKTNMVVANRQNIKNHAKELFGVEYNAELEKKLIYVCTRTSWENYHDGYSHISFAILKWMSEINRILHNFGVESIDLTEFLADIQQSSSNRYVMYSNTGDSYALTIMWYKGKLRIGSPGELMEELILTGTFKYNDIKSKVDIAKRCGIL